MLVTLLGIVTLVRRVQFWKVPPTPPPSPPPSKLSAPPRIMVIPLPMLRLAKLLQPKNACSQRLVTLSGMVTPVRTVTPANALSPMQVTGKPSTVLGMAASPPGPV